MASSIKNNILRMGFRLIWWEKIEKGYFDTKRVFYARDSMVYVLGRNTDTVMHNL